MKNLTTILDLAGALLVIFAVSLALWQWPPAAFAAGGLLTLALSYSIDRKRGRK